MRERENNSETNEEAMKIVGFVRRFFETPEDAEAAITGIIEEEPEIKKAELFRRVSARKGNPKSHVSRFLDDHFDGQLKGS